MSPDSTTQSKQCYKCLNWYPRTPEYWHKQTKNKDGLRNYCKSCSIAEFHKWYEANSQSEDYKIKSRSRAKAWQQANPERKKANEKRWRNEHREQERTRQMAWSRNHRLQERLRGKIYRENNREKEKNRKDTYRKSNMHLWRKYAQQRRARLLGASGTHTPEEVLLLLNQQGGQCFHCGVDINPLYEEDHWVPISRGGSDYIENIRLLCPPCNRSKGNKFPHEWCPDKYPPPISD